MRPQHSTARKINQEAFVNKTQDFVETSKINKIVHKNVKKVTNGGRYRGGREEGDEKMTKTDKKNNFVV